MSRTGWRSGWPAGRRSTSRPLLAFLGPRAIPGVEEVVGDTYRRSLRLPHGPAIVEVTDDGAAVRCRLALADPRDLGPAVARVRRLLDLDADPVAVDDVLGRDPVLGRLVRATPGRRAPGAVDGAELAIRAVLGQQVSVVAARTIAGRLAAAHGTPLAQPSGGLTHLFPGAGQIAGASDASLPMPASRRRTVRALATALADGSLVLDAGADRECGAGPPASDPRHRAVDGRLCRAPRARGPGRAAGRRPRRAPGCPRARPAGRPGGAPRPGRGVAPVALVRDPSPVGVARLERRRPRPPAAASRRRRASVSGALSARRRARVDRVPAAPEELVP